MKLFLVVVLGPQEAKQGMHQIFAPTTATKHYLVFPENLLIFSSAMKTYIFYQYLLYIRFRFSRNHFETKMHIRAATSRKKIAPTKIRTALFDVTLGGISRINVISSKW